MKEIQIVLTVTGLIFDIIGALIIATEVTSPFTGKRFMDPTTGGPQAGDTYGGDNRTAEFKEWSDKIHPRKLKIGLALLLFGFVLQILASLLGL